MIVYVLMSGDEVSGQLQTYCNDLPDVEKKMLDAASDEGKNFMGAHGVSNAPMVVVLDEDGKELLKSIDMEELKKFFA
ncbi:MAG: hypothetical protein ACTTH7_00070 [Treponema sp.]